MKSTLKAILKILLIVFAFLYVGVAIFVTVCLLNFNKQRITVLGDTSIIIVNEEFSDEYKKGDLLFVRKSAEEAAKVVPGSHIFFYNPSENNVINYAEVVSSSENNGQYTFILGNDYYVYYDYYVGTNPIVLKGLGSVLSILESQFGFLALIILPVMVAIIFELYAIIIEIVELKKEV